MNKARRPPLASARVRTPSDPRECASERAGPDVRSPHIGGRALLEPARSCVKADCLLNAALNPDNAMYISTMSLLTPTYGYDYRDGSPTRKEMEMNFDPHN